MFPNSKDFTANQKNVCYVLIFAVIFLIIYFYFLQWKTISIHDDDLLLYKAFDGLKGFEKRNNVSLLFSQYRPVRDIFLRIIFDLFGQNFEAYYLFNVCIQTINTLLFAFVLNLVLRSMTLSVFLSLVFGLSRFGFYTITQLFDGGVLEGLAMSFFLLFLYFITRLACNSNLSIKEKRISISWCILFAAFSMFTHERYIVLFPFILLVILFFPKLMNLTVKTRAMLFLLALTPVVLNIAVKTLIYGFPFFRGTGGADIKFSMESAFTFLWQAVLAVFQFSKGPEYLTGLQVYALPLFYQILVAAIILLLAFVFVFYFIKLVAGSVAKKFGYPPYSGIIFFLPALFFLCLVPVIFQVRAELRWFQAPLCILVLLFVLALEGIPTIKRKQKYLLLLLVGVCFLLTNYYYVEHGSKNLYYSTSARIGNVFDKAIKDGVIFPGRTNLYIVERERNADRETEAKWALVNGYFFVPYEKKSKQLVFTDLNTMQYDIAGGRLHNGFNNANDQIVFLDIEQDDKTFRYSLKDVTTEYLQDSLKEFSYIVSHGKPGSHSAFFKKGLIVTADNIEQFSNTGFYANENGMRWTNGKSVIEFAGSEAIQDTLKIMLSTFMPLVCKTVEPVVSVNTREGKMHTPLGSTREGDVFTYIFFFEGSQKVQSVNINSVKISPGADDKRELSFPFKSLQFN